MAASVGANALAHIGLGDAQQIHHVLLTDAAAFRLGLVVAFASATLFLMTAWGLYRLLRPVNPDVALLFLLLNTVGVAVQCASLLQLVNAMLIGQGGGGDLAPLQATALAQLSIETYRTGFVATQLFFGAWLFPLGYLVLRSGFLPRILGILLVADGVAEMIWFLQEFLLSTHPMITKPGTIVSLLAEVGLALWLLIKGVKPTGTHPTLAVGVPDPTPATVH